MPPPRTRRGSRGNRAADAPTCVRCGCRVGRCALTGRGAKRALRRRRSAASSTSATRSSAWIRCSSRTRAARKACRAPRSASHGPSQRRARRCRRGSRRPSPASRRASSTSARSCAAWSPTATAARRSRRSSSRACAACRRSASGRRSCRASREALDARARARPPHRRRQQLGRDRGGRHGRRAGSARSSTRWSTRSVFGVEKPDRRIFEHALSLAGVRAGCGDPRRRPLCGRRRRRAGAGIHPVLLDPYGDWPAVDCAVASDAGRDRRPDRERTRVTGDRMAARWAGEPGFFEIWFVVVFERAGSRAWWLR